MITFVRKIYNIQQYPDNSLKSFDASGSEYTAKKVSSMEGREVYFKLFDNNPGIRKLETNKVKHVNETLAAHYLKCKRTTERLSTLTSRRSPTSRRRYVRPRW